VKEIPTVRAGQTPRCLGGTFTLPGSFDEKMEKSSFDSFVTFRQSPGPCTGVRDSFSQAGPLYHLTKREFLTVLTLLGGVSGPFGNVLRTVFSRCFVSQKVTFRQFYKFRQFRQKSRGLQGPLLASLTLRGEEEEGPVLASLTLSGEEEKRGVL